MATEYWVYVNEASKKAELHKSKCGSCKYGRTMHGKRTASNDRWEGPFDARDRAWECAESAATKFGGVPTKCALCHP